MTRRLVQLYVGLVLFGISVGMLILSTLGNAPWDVLHQGLARHSSLGTGTWSVLISVVVLLLWIPLRERPGLGTVSNAIVVGVVLQVMLDTLAEPDALLERWALLVGGVLLCALASGMYIGARFGAGPRDGLMTGLARHGLPTGPTRTAIELAVLVSGWALGGTVGIGTVVYAFGIGPLVAIALPRLRTAPPGGPPPRGPAAPPRSRTAPWSAARRRA